MCTTPNSHSIGAQFISCRGAVSRGPAFSLWRKPVAPFRAVAVLGVSLRGQPLLLLLGWFSSLEHAGFLRVRVAAARSLSRHASLFALPGKKVWRRVSGRASCAQAWAGRRPPTHRLQTPPGRGHRPRSSQSPRRPRCLATSSSTRQTGLHAGPRELRHFKIRVEGLEV